MQRTHRLAAFALTGVLGIGLLMPSLTARASEEGKRNTAIGLGAAALGLLLTQRNKVPGVIAAAGAAYAYEQYDQSIRDRHRDYYWDYRGHDRYDRDHNYNWDNDRHHDDHGSYWHSDFSRHR